MKKRLLQLALVAARLIAAAMTALLFFSVVITATSKPLSELRPGDVPAQAIPKSAKSFHNEHGKVVFSEYPNAEQDPVFFGELLLGFLLSAGVLFVVCNEDLAAIE